MHPNEIPFAIRLTNQEKWGITRSALQRLLRLNPRGCFIAHDGTSRLGLLTTTTYGRELAWIGNVIVDREHRNKHIGNSMVEHAVSFLRKLGVRHIALYCFSENLRFYKNLGFVRDKPFLRLRREITKTEPTKKNVELTRPPPLDRVIAADREAFGADRSELIRAVLAEKSGWYVGCTQGTTSISYLMVKEYPNDCEFGPWICSNPTRDESDKPLRRALSIIRPVPVEVSCLQENRRALHTLQANEFQLVREGYRMFFEKRAHIGNDSAQWALGFLDKG
jgi:GNAT superfamily N-acetyltransferase